MENSNERQRVKVFIRLRPQFKNSYATNSEDSTNCDDVVDTFNTENNSVRLKIEGGVSKTYHYDGCHGPTSTQEEVYEASSKSIVESVLEGYNASLIAYGMTGSGKTHTMLGNLGVQKDAGVMPRALGTIFDHISNDPANIYAVSLSYVQIYLDEIQDLLQPTNTKIGLREDPKRGVFVSNVASVDIYNVQDFAEVLEVGNSNRVSAFTDLNAQSSRSHACLICKVQKVASKLREKGASATAADDEEDKTIFTGKLYCLDLAGSERVKKSGATGARLEEAKKINSSLSALGNCIAALASTNRQHIPYRSSTLTRLLQESLGGNSLTSLILTMHGDKHCLTDTLSTLKFGSRAMKVKNVVAQNVEENNYEALCESLQDQLAATKSQLENIRRKSEAESIVTNHLNMQELDVLKRQNKELTSKRATLEDRLGEMAQDMEALKGEKELLGESLKSTEESYAIEKEKVSEQERLMAGRQKSIDTLQIKYDTAKHTVKQMKLLLAEALENIQTKDKETKTLRAQKDDFSNSLSNLRGDLKASQDTITHLKASEHNLLNKVKAMQRDLKDGFLLGEKIKGMDSSDQEPEGFTQTLLGAVREQHAKAIERVEELMKEDNQRQMKLLKEGYERKLRHVNRILEMAHIPAPSFDDSDFEKLHKNDKKAAGSTSATPTDPAIPQLKKQIQSMQRLLQSHNHQLCARCGWGWKLFDTSDIHKSLGDKYAL
jgi:kinesin family member 5